MIRSICIFGMHGYKDVYIDFYSRCNIYLSENGQGKTTILKIINAVLSGRLEKLKSLSFQRLEVIFENGSTASINKSELDIDLESKALQYLSQRMPDPYFKSALELMQSTKSNAEVRRLLQPLVRPYVGSSTLSLVRDLVESRYMLEANSNISHFKEVIHDSFDMDCLYLPTYRRVEDDLLRFIDLSVDKRDQREGFSEFLEEIQFGLNDVEQKIDGMKNAIIAASNASMARINGEILSRLIGGYELNGEDIKLISDNYEKLNLVLNRVATTLNSSEKAELFRALESGELFSKDSKKHLVYFLSRMVKGFLEQQKHDEALTRFSDLCSGYFENKTMQYDDLNVTIKIFCENSGGEIKFGDLSSGEKQIVSLFSKLLLEPERKYLILFDEPELSLSVEWQKKILVDVMSCQSCEFLMAMTHSPFVFADLQQYTQDLASAFLYNGKIKKEEKLNFRFIDESYDDNFFKGFQ